jgi:hypothetical protein
MTNEKNRIFNLGFFFSQKEGLHVRMSLRPNSEFCLLDSVDSKPATASPLACELTFFPIEIEIEIETTKQQNHKSRKITYHTIRTAFLVLTFKLDKPILSHCLYLLSPISYRINTY